MKQGKRKDIDHLTSKLIQGTAEQPSSSLNTKIMEQIMRERSWKGRVYVKNMPSVGTIIIVLVAYCLVVLGFGLIPSLSQSVIASFSLDDLKVLFPLLLTIGGGASLFFFFAQLDRWLNRERKSQ